MNTTEFGPLSGILVVDLTQHLAGPVATQILGDLGARVIKVEPLQGDTTRLIAPYYVAGESDYYISANRNKESIALNLKKPEGRQLLLDLARRADVVIDNFKPGTMHRLGLDYEAFQAVKPDLVVCSISGFGQTGSLRESPAFDMVIQALSGVMSITGEEGGHAVRTGIPVADVTAGLYGAISVLSGLSRRDRFGLGSYIDVSMYDGQLTMLSYLAAYYLLAGEVPGLQGRRHRSTVTYRAYDCADGAEIVVTASNQAQFSWLCEALELGEWGAQFHNNMERLERRAEVDAVIEGAFARLTIDEALGRLHKWGVPCGRIRGVDDALDDPATAEREMVIELTGDEPEQQARVVGNPIKIRGYTEPRRFPARVGEHTAAVLRELLDLDPDAVERLAADDVVATGSERPVAADPV